MDLNLIVDNILSPAILFFFLGVLAVLVKSDLEIPAPLPKFFSLYLLLAIGFKGGVELNASGITAGVFITLTAAIFMASVVPVYSYFILRIKLNKYDAAAVSATYGSISAITFITAAAFLQKLEIPFGGFLVAAMALMESPAIVIAVLINKISNGGDNGKKIEWKELLKDAFLNSSVFLILGSLIIGFVTGEKGHESLKPFTDDIFKGILAFFLLDMGLLAARRLGVFKKGGVFLISFAILLPLLNAGLGILLAYIIGLPKGDAFLFTILCASASYIAVPAAMRLTIPEANPGLFVPMSLGITFPFNIIAGLPLYMFVINYFWK